MKTLRRALDALYFGAGVAAAGALVVILLMIVAQMLARWTGEVFAGAAAYAGYAMAAGSFLAFAHTLNRGAHIRVSILLQALGPRALRFVEIWCFGMAAIIVWWFVWNAAEFVWFSWKFNEISQEQDETMLWIAQAPMLIGAVIFAIALTDHLVQLIFTGRHGIERDLAEQSRGE